MATVRAVRKFNRSTLDQAVALYASGLSCAKVAAQLHMSVPYVKDVVRAAGVTMRPRGFQPGNAGNPGPRSEEFRLRMSEGHRRNNHRPSVEAAARGRANGIAQRWVQYQKDPVAQFEGQYRRGAASRGLPYELSRELFESLVMLPCYYCGDPPVRRPVNVVTLVCNGLDRLDNRLGYVPSNVVPCCTSCNRMKMAQPSGEFIERCVRIAKLAESRKCER